MEQGEKERLEVQRREYEQKERLEAERRETEAKEVSNAERRQKEERLDTECREREEKKRLEAERGHLSVNEPVDEQASKGRSATDLLSDFGAPLKTASDTKTTEAFSEISMEGSSGSGFVVDLSSSVDMGSLRNFEFLPRNWVNPGRYLRGHRGCNENHFAHTVSHCT